jgi:magnesium transporter
MPSPSDNEPSDENEALLDAVSHRDAEEAADLLELETGAEAARVLSELNPMVAQRVLAEMEDGSRDAVIASASPEQARQWRENRAFPEDSIGWLMEPAPASFAPGVTVAESVEALRHLAKTAFITYGYVVDDEGKLLGLLVMRDLLLAAPETRLGDVMLREPFSLDPGLELTDAMRLVVHRHYPVYPVCDGTGRLLGQVRGQSLFEARAIEISAQAGQMVGVEEGERLSTPLARSLRSRHPWLQLNLLTCFVAAAVVGVFQETLDRIVVLAAFLPVLAGQSGNTGSQALAVALRGMTLGDLGKGGERKLVVKEGLLGLLNGLFTGLSAGIGMWLYAHFQGQSDAWILGLVVWMAMVASCVVSGLAGALIPLALKRFGADPATASGIFLTTATDVISIGAFLGLASWMVS